MALLPNLARKSVQGFEQLSLSLSHLARARHRQSIAWHSCNPHFTHSFLRFSLAFILVFSLFCGVARADSAKNSDPYKVGIKKPKTGGFVGGEIGFGGAWAFTDRINYNDIAQNNRDYVTSVSKDYIVFPMNIIGGYQWYFYDRPWFHFGVRVRGHIGYTNYNTEISRNYNSEFNNINLSISAHGIQYGVEAEFLWDFLNIGEHTLGWHFSPIGLEGSTFFGSYNAIINDDPTKDFKISGDLVTHTKFAYMFNTGFHYYYNAKHIAFATFRSRGYSISERNSTAEKIGYSTTSHYTLMLGYAYKF